MKVKVKKRNDPNEQLRPCLFLDSCFGACDWCKTHDYSEACVPMLIEKVNEQAGKIQTLNDICRTLERKLADAKGILRSCTNCTHNDAPRVSPKCYECKMFSNWEEKWR